MPAEFRARTTSLQAAATAVGALAVRAPWAVLVLSVFVTAALAPLAARVGYDDDVLGFLPDDEPEVERFRDIGRRFGGLSVGVIGVAATDGDLFTPERLCLLQRVTQGVRTVEGIEHSSSVTHLLDADVAQEGGEEITVVGMLIDELPCDDPQSIDAAAIRARVLSRDHVRGALISPRGDAALVLANVRPDVPVRPIAEEVRAMVDGWLPGVEGVRVYYGGAPFVGSYVAQVARDDILRLSPWISLAIIVIVLLTSRSVLGATIALGSVGMGIVWVLGMFTLVDEPLTLVSSSLPVLLIALGSAYSIHLLARILDNLDAGEVDRRRAVLDSMAHVGPPVLVAGLTTAAGFVSFQVMNIEPMRDFGLWMTVGTLVVVLLGMLVVPAAAVILPLRGRPGGRAPAWAVRAMAAAALAAARRPVWTFGLTAALVIACGVAIRVVPGGMDMRAFFAEDSEPVAAEAFLEARLGGSVFVQAQVAGDIKSPLVLLAIERLAAEACAMPGVTDVQSVAVPMLIGARALTGARRIPAAEASTRAIATLLDSEDPNIRLLVDAPWRHALLQIKVQAGSPDTPAALKAALEGRRERRLAAVSRGALNDVQRAAERRAVEGHVRAALRCAGRAGPQGLGDALAVRYTDVSPAGVGRLEARLEEALGEEDPLIALADPGALAALKPNVIRGLAARTLEPPALAEAIAAVAHPDELEDREALDTAAASLYASLRDIVEQDAVDRRLEAVAGLIGEPLPERDHLALRRALAVLDDPYAVVPAEAAGGASERADIEVAVTGFPLVYQRMNEAVQRNQVSSLALTAVLVITTLSIFFRSAVLGLVATIPAGLTLAVMFAVMGLLRIPMDVGSTMLASIAMGVGIDYAVHLAWRYGAEVNGTEVNGTEETGATRDEAVVRTLGATGWGIVINALEVSLGFGILAFGSLVPMKAVGLLTSTAMAVGAVTTLVLLPALLRWAWRITRKSALATAQPS